MAFPWLREDAKLREKPARAPSPRPERAPSPRANSGSPRIGILPTLGDAKRPSRYNEPHIKGGGIKALAPQRLEVERDEVRQRKAQYRAALEEQISETHARKPTALEARLKRARERAARLDAESPPASPKGAIARDSREDRGVYEESR